MSSAQVPLDLKQAIISPDHILYALDNKSFTALIMIDMSTAFDIVDHIVLLNKLSKRLGIDNTALSWFKSYLSSRSQCISVNNCVSEPCLFSSGVSQVLCLHHCYSRST